MENQNRFDPLANGSGTKASQTGSDKNKFISGLKFVSIRGKKLELLASLDKRYKIQEALFYVGYIITDNISNYSYFPTKHIIKLIINKCKTGSKKKYILVKTLT